MRIERVGQRVVAGRTARAAKNEGFGALLDAPAADGNEAAREAAEAAPATALTGLMDYDTALDAVKADRQARSHGKAMLQALGSLQVGLLGWEEDDARRTLADLAAHMPEADDPVLKLILREIGVRAAVVLARFPN